MKTLKFNLVHCTDNRSYSEESIKSLAENIAAVGLINPVTLKAFGEEYIVAAGRRRFKALQYLARTAFEPGEYRVLDVAKDADLVAFAENHQRQDLTLAEELTQLEALKDKMPVPEIAKMLGRSHQYVALRLNLCNLIPELKEKLNSENLDGWSIAALEVIAREPESIQHSCKWWSPCSAKNVEERIACFHGDLDKALFDTSACASCKRCFGKDNVLFADMEENRRCTDTACYFKKQEAHINDVMIPDILANRPEIKYFVVTSYVPVLPKIDKIKILHYHHFKEVKGKPNALAVAGDKAGQFIRIKPDDNEADNTVESSAAAEPEKKGKTLEEREAELTAKRAKLAMDKFYKYLNNKQEILENLEKEPNTFSRLLKCAVIFGLKADCYIRNVQKEIDRERNINKHLLKYSMENIKTHVRAQFDTTLDNIDDRNCKAIAGLLAIDWKPFADEAEKEIPPSKALLAARLEARNSQNRK